MQEGILNQALVTLPKSGFLVPEANPNLGFVASEPPVACFREIRGNDISFDIEWPNCRRTNASESKRPIPARRGTCKAGNRVP